MATRREFLKYTGLAGLGLVLTKNGLVATALPAGGGVTLSDPALQPKFVNLAPNALDPAFKYLAKPRGKNRDISYRVEIAAGEQATGLVHPKSGRPLKTPIWGYSDGSGPTWPGRTFEVNNTGTTTVRWSNMLDKTKEHLVPVDTNLHWCYSLPGYTQYSIANNGVPIITHLHGGNTDYQFDGNPEFFYNPGANIVGPQWANVPGGFTKDFVYNNNVQAGTLWYHDHALGITRLNVYAGLAGFYIVRDPAGDSGLAGNTLGLPAFPYELAYAIQDRMFTDRGELFYPAFPGDPFYDDFIYGEGATLPPSLFPNGGPTGLAEFFGDHIVVNGINWPKQDVEPRNYRMRLLNGTDSRFMVLRFRQAASLSSTSLAGAGEPLPFYVIGSDQGFASEPTEAYELIFEPGARYDIVFDFAGMSDSRIIMENIGGDAPFGGDYGADLGPDDFFPDRQTDRVMAFDVILPLDTAVSDATPISAGGWATDPAAEVVVSGPVARTRKVALFEGKDEFGRLQPLLGTAEPATDWDGNAINWPNDPKYSYVGLTGQMEGAIAWHSPTTENPELGTTEEWEIYNMTGDAHPIHLHLVHFEVLGRETIKWDSNTISPGPDVEEDRVLPNDAAAAGDGTYLVEQATVQHNSVAGDDSTYGVGFRIGNATGAGDIVPTPDGVVENTPKDMVTALPGQITKIRAHFDKPGRYVWHCHILSHEDHEMMRVLHVTDPNA